MSESFRTKSNASQVTFWDGAIVVMGLLGFGFIFVNAILREDALSPYASLVFCVVGIIAVAGSLLSEYFREQMNEEG